MIERENWGNQSRSPDRGVPQVVELALNTMGGLLLPLPWQGIAEVTEGRGAPGGGWILALGVTGGLLSAPQPAGCKNVKCRKTYAEGESKRDQSGITRDDVKLRLKQTKKLENIVKNKSVSGPQMTLS